MDNVNYVERAFDLDFFLGVTVMLVVLILGYLVKQSANDRTEKKEAYKVIEDKNKEIILVQKEHNKILLNQQEKMLHQSQLHSAVIDKLEATFREFLNKM